MPQAGSGQGSVNGYQIELLEASSIDEPTSATKCTPCDRPNAARQFTTVVANHSFGEQSGADILIALSVQCLHERDQRVNLSLRKIQSI